MWVRILAWSVATLVSVSKALDHHCFSPPRSTNGNQWELGSNLRWIGILSRGNRNILSRIVPRTPDINTGLPDEQHWLRTDFTFTSRWANPGTIVAYTIIQCMGVHCLFFFYSTQKHKSLCYKKSEELKFKRGLVTKQVILPLYQTFKSNFNNLGSSFWDQRPGPTAAILITITTQRERIPLLECVFCVEQFEQ